MSAKINNDFYDELGERWWNDDAHAIAILRVESKLKIKFVIDRITRYLGSSKNLRILDIACGAGFLSLPLGENGYDVKGIDFSQSSIDVARGRIKSGSKIVFEQGDATKLKESDESYDCAMLMDCLEHFDHPELAVQEAARVLKPGGLMIVHTFNRTWLSRILAVHAIQFLSKGTPDHVHIYEMFITPEELKLMGENSGMTQLEVTGIRPNFRNRGFWSSLFNRSVRPGFEFEYCSSLAVGYIAVFWKRPR